MNENHQSRLENLDPEKLSLYYCEIKAIQEKYFQEARAKIVEEGVQLLKNLGAEYPDLPQLVNELLTPENLL